MNQQDTSQIQESIDKLDIMELAKQHCKPRIELSTIEAKTKAKKAEKADTRPVDEVQYNVKRLIMITIAVPFQTTSRYYELLGLNYREGNAAKTFAVEKGILIQHNFHSGRRGGKSVLLEPTRAAFAAFRMPFPYENPGFLHRFLQRQVKDIMTAQGYKATIEKLVKGKNIDVVLERGSEKIAVEIAVTDKHEMINVKKDIFQAGFGKVVIVGKDKKTVKAVEKKIAAAFDKNVQSKVRCCMLADIVNAVAK